MPRKKKSQVSLTSKAAEDIRGESSSIPPSPGPQSPHQAAGGKKGEKNKPTQPSTSALIICRNKHWRYISSFHGPWLQLPPDILETLSYSNYASPRPHPIDPAVFFDIVKIRRAIEEATDLAVRAANGTTSSALGNSLNASNGLLGGGSSAALGLGIGGGGGHAKLSRERRHRMREHATQKLAKAYRLDEIAASVATMQSASALEEVAKLVLQRNESDCDAKYVHFFHEKIPSRSLVECTSLKPLDEIIVARPREGSTFRTRAVTKVFKEDYAGAARDLTEALGAYRHHMTPHMGGKSEASSPGAGREDRQPTMDIREELKVNEKDQPTGLETQLLFHRAGVYLGIACEHVKVALDDLKLSQQECAPDSGQENEGQGSPTSSPAGKEAYRRWLESRKIVKTNARRALRDYMSFLSHFDYTPGLSSEVAEAFLRKVNYTSSGNFGKPRRPRNPSGRLLESGSTGDGDPENDGDSTMPSTIIHKVSELFFAQPPSDLPPFPAETQELVPASHAGNISEEDDDSHEAVTYHPLLTDALHSLLLCHALVQTSSKELLRHAHMVARVVRVCDGYPIFLAARSPSRADWIEVINHVTSWVDLKQSWESLCAPAPLAPSRGGGGGSSHTAFEKTNLTEEEEREHRKHEAILEALGDDRVCDEATFRSAVHAREKRLEQQHQHRRAGGQGAASPLIKRWGHEDGKEYPICTERAEAIIRWVQESPLTTGEGRTKAKKGKKKRVSKCGNENLCDDGEEEHDPELKTTVEEGLRDMGLD